MRWMRSASCSEIGEPAFCNLATTAWDNVSLALAWGFEASWAGMNADIPIIRSVASKRCWTVAGSGNHPVSKRIGRPLASTSFKASLS